MAVMLFNQLKGSLRMKQGRDFSEIVRRLPIHSRRMNLRNLIGALALVAAAAGTPAMAATIYDSLTDGFQSFMAWDVDSSFIPAAQFTSPGDYTVTEISVALMNFGGTNGATISLYNANPSGAPGTVLGTWNVFGQPTGGVPLTTITGIQGVDLVAGQNYFLQIAPADESTIDAWYFCNDGDSGPLYNGETLAYAKTTEPAYAIFGVLRGNTNAVSFQINSAHTGITKFPVAGFPTAAKWQVNLGGSPSYALIADSKVFVTVNVAGNTQLIALDQATGKTVWGPIVLSGQSNAAYDNGNVFVVGTDGLMQAFHGDTGKPLWTISLTGQYIFSSAPTAAKGTVFTVGSGGAGTVYAVDEKTGALVWTEEVNNGDDSTPAVTADGVYVAYPCWTYDLSPSTGASVWTNDTGCDGGGGGTPVVANGLLYAPNGVGTYNGDVFNASTGKLVFSYVADNPPAIDSIRGYFLQKGTLVGLKLDDYSIAWSFAGDGKLVTSPIGVDNYVFVGSSSGNLYGLNSATGAQVWQVNVGAAIPGGAGWGAGLQLSGLAAGNGLLVVPAGNTLSAYQLSGN
jgi:outer membrane protein assembly factor BamB